MLPADVLLLGFAAGGDSGSQNGALQRRCHSICLRQVLRVTMALAMVSAALRAEVPMTTQALETLKASYTFQPVDIKPEDPLMSPPVSSPENIIQLEKMIVMESVVGRGVSESVDKQQAVFKQARFNWETGGFYYRKVGTKFTVEAGVWSRGPDLTLLTVSW